MEVYRKTGQSDTTPAPDTAPVASWLAYAEDHYAPRGWHVVPLHNPTEDPNLPCSCRRADCHTPGKHPRTRHGEKDASAQPGVIRAWASEFPYSNLGIVLAPSGLLDLAADSPHREAEFARRGYSDGPAYRSGGGEGHVHRLFRRPEGCPVHRICKSGEYDLLTNGLVVCPTSAHVSGRRYEWIASPEQFPALPDPAEWMVEMLAAAVRDDAETERRIAERQSARADWLRRGTNDQDYSSLDYWSGRRCKTKPNGEIDRSRTLHSIAWELAGIGVDQSDIERELAERDELLDLHKFSSRKDGGAREYARMAKKAAGGAVVREYRPIRATRRSNGKNGAGPDEANVHALRGVKATGENDEWPELISLDAVDLPEFPIDALEPWMREKVEATAIALQVPLDLPGMLSLSALSTAFQRRVEGVVREGWIEPLSLYILISALSGERKSAAYRQVTQPITDYEADLVRLMADEIMDAKTEHDTLSAAWEQAKKKAARTDPGREREKALAEAKEIGRALEARPLLASPRLMADDTTTEKMGILLSEQGGRMALLSPEGDAFDMLAGRYQNGVANIGVYLRAHAGEDVYVDRVGRSSIVVPRAAISMGLTIQPHVLLGMTANPAFKGRGLLARFLFATPRSLVGDREIRPESIPAAISERYTTRIKACLQTASDTDTHGRPVPHRLLFSPAADDAIADFERWIEPQLKPGGDLGTMEGWASKLAGATARIAALLHLASLAGTTAPWKIPVDAETVARATQIAEYLIPHAQAAFLAMGTDPAVKGARTILGWIRKNNAAEFSREELRASLRRQFARAEEMDDPLKMLMEYGHIRQTAPEAREGPGRPPSPRFQSHPSLWSR